MPRLDTPHPYRHAPQGGGACADCKRPPEHPLHIHVLPGMDDAVAAQDEAAAAERGRELTEMMREPLKSIDARTGDMEKHSPLFRDTDANPHARLF